MGNYDVNFKSTNVILFWQKNKIYLDVVPVNHLITVSETVSDF